VGHARYCSSAEKCHFMPCITVFSVLKMGHQGSSAVQGSWATFSTEKCQFKPFIAIFSALKTSIFSPGKA
jgi:hypothetical protein